MRRKSKKLANQKAQSVSSFVRYLVVQARRQLLARVSRGFEAQGADEGIAAARTKSPSRSF